MAGDFSTTFGNSDQNDASVSATSFTGTLTAGSDVITSVSSTTGIKTGMLIYGPFGITNYTPATVLSVGNGVIVVSETPTYQFNGHFTNASNTITVDYTTYNLAVGMSLAGNGIANGTTITDIAGSVISISTSTTSSSSGTEVINATGTFSGVAFTFFNEEDAFLSYTTPTATPSSAGNGNLGPYAISLTSSTNGSRQFAIDTSFEPYRREAFRHRTIPAQRQSIMMTNIAGQGTVNTEGLWRREQTEWSMGAGQQYLDRKSDSQETRFYQSKGVDVFSFPLQATLLPDTFRKDSIGSVNNNLMMSRCGDYVVYVNGATVSYVNATPTGRDGGGRLTEWGSATTCTFNTIDGGTAPSTIYSITTNDTYVFIAADTGIWLCNIATSSQFYLYMAPDTDNEGYTLVRWANDQLIASNGNKLYAIQPRQDPTISTNTYPFWGNPPSTANAQSSITTIEPQYNGTNFALVTTQTPHNLVAGQPISITDSATSASITSITQQITFTGNVTSGSVTITNVNATGLVVGMALTSSHITSGQTITAINGKTLTISAAATGTATKEKITAAFTGYATVQTGVPHNLGAGEDITIAVTAPTGAVAYNTPNANQPAPTVKTVVDSTTFIYETTAPTGTTAATAGTVSGNGSYGYNTTYQVASVISTTQFTIACTFTGAGATKGTVVNSSLPDLLYAHENPSWIWSDATSGLTQIYYSGYVKSGSGKFYSGGIYRSDLLGSSTSTAAGISTITSSSITAPFQLDTPILALPMSPDEYPVCLASYLNFIFVGTNRGIRMTQTLSIYDPTATATGDLKSGPLIPNILQPVTQPVTAIVGDGRYVWFAWNNYDDQSTGLGKLDLAEFIKGDPLTPAYASDIMVNQVPGANNIINSLDWDPYFNTPIMAIGGSGIWGPSAQNEGGNPIVYKYVPSGNITSGIFDYGIPDKKIPVYFDYGAIAPASKGTGIQAFIDIDPNDSDAAGLQVLPSYPQNGDTSVSEFPVPNYHAEQFSVSLTLISDAPNHGYSPILHRWTLKAWPAAVAGTSIMIVVQLFSVAVVDGMETFVDPYDNFIWLENRRQNQEILTYQEGPLSVTGVIDTLDWLPHKRRDNYENGFEGDCVITFKTVSPYVYTPVQQIL